MKLSPRLPTPQNSKKTTTRCWILPGKSDWSRCLYGRRQSSPTSLCALPATSSSTTASWRIVRNSFAGTASDRRIAGGKAREPAPRHRALNSVAGEPVLVVIPTLNEAEHLDQLLRAVLALAPYVSVLVVDDGSSDGTREIAEKLAGEGRVHLMARQRKLGLGRAYVDGFSWGLEREFGIFVEMDGDLSHDPAQLPALLDSLRGSGVVIGSRYVPGGRVVGWSRFRHLLSRTGNAYARIMLGFSVADSTSGFRCYRREVLETIGLRSIQSEGYAFQIEMAHRAWRAGYKIKEVPITFKERTSGKSKMSKAIVAEAIMSVTIWGLKNRWRSREGESSGETAP